MAGSGLLGSPTRRHVDRFLFDPVDGVMQLDLAQTEVVGGPDPHRDLFDAARAPVAARFEHLDFRTPVRDGGNEVIFGQPHALAAIHGGDVVDGILVNLDLRPVAAQGQFLLADHQQSIVEPLVCREDDGDAGPLDRHHVAPGILNRGI